MCISSLVNESLHLLFLLCTVPLLMFEDMLTVYSVIQGRLPFLVILVCKGAIFTSFTISLTM